jgi:hypothetical protein
VADADSGETMICLDSAFIEIPETLVHIRIVQIT